MRTGEPLRLIKVQAARPKRLRRADGSSSQVSAAGGEVERMRVALFTETFLPKIDGISNTIRYLLEHLATRGHASLLFSPAGGPKRYADTPVVGLKGSSFPLYQELTLVPPHTNVRTRLRSFRPDIIHVLNPVSLGIAGLREARGLGVPVVASYHTDVPGFAARWGLGILSRPLWSYLRWVHDQADLTLCPSSATKGQLQGRGFKRLKVWARGVDSGRFSPAHRSPAWRDRLTDGNPEAPLLLYVGRLSPEKRVEWLTELTDALPSVRLAVVGDGLSRSSLERHFAGRPVVFTGYLTGQDLSCAYASSDLFVFPAANETFGNVVLEAMSSGLPVVAPRAGGVLELVVDGHNGLLFDPEDARSMVRRARRLVIDVQLANDMGTAGRSMAEERSWARVMDGLLDDYWRLLGGGRPGSIPLLIPRHRTLARDAQPAGE